MRNAALAESEPERKEREKAVETANSLTDHRWDFDLLRVVTPHSAATATT